MLQIYKIPSNFDSNLLICDPTQFPGKNNPNIAKSDRIVPGKGRGDRALTLNSPMAEDFPQYCLSFLISAIFRGKRVVRVEQKAQTLGPSLFHENSHPSSFFQTMFLFARVLPLIRNSTILNHICGSKGPETSQKEPFHGC